MVAHWPPNLAANADHRELLRRGGAPLNSAALLSVAEFLA